MGLKEIKTCAAGAAELLAALPGADSAAPDAEGAAAAFAMNLSAVVGSLALGWAADKVGYRWLLVAVFAGLAGALYALAAATGLPMILAASAAAGFTVIGGLYVLYALAPVYYPPPAYAPPPYAPHPPPCRARYDWRWDGYAWRRAYIGCW